jgi:hypothetical protein
MSQLIRMLGLVTAILSPVSSYSQYTAQVVNFKSGPVFMKALKDEPGFIVENKSKRPISQFRFGCVKETKCDRTVPFALIPEHIPLEAIGPQSNTTFKGWTSAQNDCAKRSSKVAVIEVLFVDGSSWAAPLKFDKVLGRSEPATSFTIP